MAKVTPEEYAEKWGRRLKQSTDDIRRGVERVSVAPGVKAAEQQELMLQKLIESVNDGTWAKQVKAVSLEDWKESFVKKGLGRIAAGVDAATPKQAEMAGRLLAAVDATVVEVNKTPRGTLEDNIQRMTTFARGMHARKLKKA